MAVTDWVQTAAVIYFAWQQNRIFKRQNEIFANQAGQTAVINNASPLLKRLKHYWPTVIMVVLMALTAYDIYDRHTMGTAATNPVPTSWWWPYGPVLLLIVGAIGLMIGRLTRTQVPSVSTAPTKLVIHSANYGAARGGSQVFDVSDFLRKIIVGDSLVLDIENHNFVVGNRNFVPTDPLPFKVKRLQVRYSYGGQPASTIERYEHGRLVLPEDSEVKRLSDEINQVRRELETEKARADGVELSRGSAIKLDAAQIGKAGGLHTRAGEAEVLAIELEKIWHLYLQKKENLGRPLSAKALPAWAEYHQEQLFRFRTIYRWHIDSVKELDSSFHSKAIDHGFPNDDEYVDVKRNLEEHARLLRELAGTLVSHDARTNLYAEKHRLEDELEALELPKPSPSLRDVPMDTISSALMQTVLRPMTYQERYESEKRERRIKRLKEELKIIEESLNAAPKST
jgi:hypothetical protein